MGKRNNSFFGLFKTSSYFACTIKLAHEIIYQAPEDKSHTIYQNLRHRVRKSLKVSIDKCRPSWFYRALLRWARRKQNEKLNVTYSIRFHYKELFTTTFPFTHKLFVLVYFIWIANNRGAYNFLQIIIIVYLFTRLVGDCSINIFASPGGKTLVLNLMYSLSLSLSYRSHTNVRCTGSSERSCERK